MNSGGNGNHADAIFTACKACCKLLIVLVVSNPIFCISWAQSLMFPQTEIALKGHPEGKKPSGGRVFLSEYLQVISSIQGVCAQQNRIERFLDGAKVNIGLCDQHNDSQTCFPNEWHFEQLEIGEKRSYGACSRAINDLLMQRDKINSYSMVFQGHVEKYRSAVQEQKLQARREAEQAERQRRQREDVEQRQNAQMASIQFEEQRKNIDLIAQVLNFSSGLGDNGSSDETWIKSDKQCVYLKIERSSNRIGRLDLNELDPTSIRFKYEYLDLSWRPGWYTVIYANDKRVLIAEKQLDIARLQNGWSKVLNQCQGKKRAF